MDSDRVSDPRASMNHRLTPTVTCLAAFVVAAGAAPAGAQEATRHTLVTEDGVEFPAWEYRAGTAEAPYLLLFHQGGSSGRAEYEPILPRLARLGYHAVVIDQRRGGELFDAQNSVSPDFDPESTSYCDAYPELEATLDFARRRSPGTPTIVWGSSYSAALVVQLGARRPDDVAGVLAFSPATGDPMAGCEPERWLDALEVPLFAARPANEYAIPEVAEQLERFGAAGATTWVADPGRHGSSMLVPERVGASTEPTWEVVEAFLRRVAGDSEG